MNMDKREEKGKLRIEPEHILYYLQTNELPLQQLYEKKRKRLHFKRRASEFIIEDYKLFFIRPTYQRVSTGIVHRVPQKRLVLFSNEDKLQAFYECHLNKIGDHHTGEHNGIVKTSQLFSEKYYVPFHYEMMDKLRKNCPTCCEKTSGNFDKLVDDITILNQIYGEKHSDSVLDVGGCPQGKSTSKSHKGSTSAIPNENEMYFDCQFNSVSNEEDERGENYEDDNLGSDDEDHNYVVKRSDVDDITGKDADEDEITGKDEDNTARKDEDEDNITGKDADEGDIAGKDANVGEDEDEITGKDEDNIAGKDEDDDNITGKDADEGDIAGKDANVGEDEDGITGKDEDNIAGKNADKDDMTVNDAVEDEIAEKDANEDEIAGKEEVDISGKDEDADEITGKDADEDEITGKDAEEDEIAGKDEEEDEIAGKDEDEYDMTGKGEDEDDMTGKDEDEDDMTGKDEDEDDIAGKGEDEDDIAGKYEDEDDIAVKYEDEDDIAGKDEDVMTGKDEDDMTGKDEDDMTGKDEDEDDIAGKDEDDMAGKDEDDMTGKDEDEDDMAGKDADVLTMIQRDEMADEHTSKTDMRTSAIEPKEPTKFWHSVEVCVFGPYDHWGKKKYVLVFLDLYSVWPEVMVVDTLSPTTVTMGLLNLVCRYHIMKKLYLKQSKGIPLSSYTPDIGLLKSADLNVDIIHSNDHYTDHLWRAMRNHVSNYIGNNIDWPQSLSFAFIPLRMTDEDGSYSLFINNKREIEDKFIMKERFSSFEECQEKLLKAYRSCTSNSMNSNDTSESSGSNANTSVLKSILSPNQNRSNSDLADFETSTLTFPNTNVIHDEVPIQDCNNKTTVSTKQDGNIDNINTAGTWPYYMTDVQKRLSTKTSDSTEETTRPDSEGSLHFVESLCASPNDEIVNTKTALARKSDINNIVKADPTNQSANVICTRSSGNSDILKTENTGSSDDFNFTSHIPDFNMTKSKSKTLSISPPPPSKDHITINTRTSAKRKRLTDVSCSEDDCEKSAEKKSNTKRRVLDAVIGKSDKVSKNILQNTDNDGVELLPDDLDISDDFKVCNTREVTGKDSNCLLLNRRPTVALQRLPISTENTVSAEIDDAITPKVRRTDKDKSEELSCYICKLTFKHFKELKYHMQNHLSTKRVKCGECGQILSTKYSLRRHEVRLHKNVKPDGPHSCQKVVRSSQLLNAHQRYHREYDISLCLICGKRLKTISMRLHSDVIIFNCRQCSRGFSTEEGLNTHVTFKHANARPPNECPVCKKRYTRKVTMERHFQTKHENMKTFLCDKCGKRICRKENHQTT